MDEHQKLIIRYRLGLAVKKLLAENRQDASGTIINSLHRLAKSGDLEYYTVQNVSVGKKDPQWTSVVSIANGFNIPVSKLIEVFEAVSDEEAFKYIEDQKLKAKTQKSKKKHK
ncbi:MAG: hypothetical protein DI535_02600 [Citrobacter freundii]|nr:MAG: hypothetical protein DI535_02600 [Citrobacter freundii]